ncbi:hypothetical protein [Nocardioides perillae]|uniref:Uncharacterized protein n=1 Tax=Nocardioides perillae TaxID=1119534 RepID=A0A7Y9RVJ2_9ACTN|nr:hypothetical protein [Nocardioides perillae]NYG55373.1 hypothetical protein [Nocardioides perillae]
MSDSLVSVGDDGVLVAAGVAGTPDDAQVLRWYPALDHDLADPADRAVTPGDGRVAQVARTHALLLSQPWWSWGAETGANEHGVVVVRTPAAVKARVRGGDALGSRDLVRLALERGADRREAAEHLVTLLEEHGQGGDGRGEAGTAYVVADREGATVVETAGRAHATAEVDGTRALSGGLTIPDFAAAHADRRAERRLLVTQRRTRGEAYLATLGEGADGAGADPVGRLTTALRDHGPKSRGLGPHYRRRAGAVGGACMHAGGLLSSTQTVSAWVSDLRGPAGLHWATGTSTPCTSVFVPLRVDDPAPLDPVDPPLGQEYDGRYLWWRHERLHRLALRDPERALPVVTQVRDRLEADWRAAPPTTDEALALGDAWRDDLVDHLTVMTEMQLGDTRPVRVAAQWRRWNRDAGLGA